VSADEYYWGIALKIWDRAGLDWSENLLQDWARTLGFGAPTGIDLPFEQSGIVPDRAWFQYNQTHETGLVRLTGPWSGGDLMNMAIGQGSMLSTPLQLANAYCALVNGGTLWRPRAVSEIHNSQGDIIFRNVASVVREVPISADTVASLKQDLHGVVSDPRGTAYIAFQGFGDSIDQVGGKTGTSQIRLATHHLIIDLSQVPAGGEAALAEALAEQLQVTVDDIQQQLDAGAADGQVTLTNDVPQSVVTYVEEHGADFPGVTSEVVPEVDTAWFVGVAPLDNPQYVVAVVIEEGGSGGKIAAPTARAILQYLMGEQVDTIRSGEEAN
jgi:cell division protein FtsI/penicillin-binding protein 2